jgi:ATP-dependent DNA helicase RecQ
LSQSREAYSIDSNDEYEMEISPSLESSFVDAELIAMLAEKFKLASFKPFQRRIIEATFAGEDTLVLYPTGSGKSLCYQFPPVYLNKKAIIVTPTISLMQDQVAKLKSLGLSAVYLGSAQFDKKLETSCLDPSSNELIIFVTPEWILNRITN